MEYKKQTPVGMFMVSTVRFETPIKMYGENIRACETMVFERQGEGIKNYQDLYSEKHEWDADLNKEHERIVKRIEEGLISLPAPPVDR